MNIAKRIMIEPTEEEKREEHVDTVSQADPKNDKEQRRSGTLRDISYVILFFGAVFIISALETGSYRTPWPVAILTTLAGVGLFVYSRQLTSREQ